jgi:hypothetical protein
MKILWLLPLASLLALSAVASADATSNDDVSQKVLADGLHDGGHHGHGDDDNNNLVPRVEDKSRGEVMD